MIDLVECQCTTHTKHETCLEKARKVNEARLQGKWRSIDHDVRAIYLTFDHRMAFASTSGNAAFIAFASEFVPEAIEEIERLRKHLVLAEMVCELAERFAGKLDLYDGHYLCVALDEWRKVKG
jgi:hypothetical protein